MRIAAIALTLACASYGDYAVDVGGKTLAFTLVRGTTDYQVR